MATEWRPIIRPGITYNATITLPSAQTGYTAYLILKSNEESTVVVADWSSYVSTGDDTIYTVAVLPAATELLDPGSYYIYFKLQNAGDTDADLWAEGTATVRGSDDT